MTVIYKRVKKVCDELELIECDRCGKQILHDNILEFQEVFSWKNTGGYGSVWGDGTTVEIDLCQNCTHDLFKNFAKRR